MLKLKEASTKTGSVLGYATTRVFRLRRADMSPMNTNGIILVMLIMFGLHCEGALTRGIRRRVSKIDYRFSSVYTQQSTFLSIRVRESPARGGTSEATLYMEIRPAENLCIDRYTLSKIASVSSYGPEGTEERRTRTSSPFRKLAPDFGILTSDPTGR